MRTLAMVVLLVTPVMSFGENMQEYLSKTQDLVRQGEHEEALKRFLWFHEHALEHEPSMYGVRLSFALGYWKELADRYPPALDAMKSVRDENIHILENGGGDFHLFHDVVALNRTLGEEEITVGLFETLHEKGSPQLERYWDVAKDAVFEEKRYDLARKYIGDLAQEFADFRAAYERNEAFYEDPRIGGEAFKSYNENKLVQESLKLIEYALMFDDRESARDIKKRALSMVDDDRLRDAVPEAGEEDAEPGESRNSETPAEKQRRLLEEQMRSTEGDLSETP